MKKLSNRVIMFLFFFLSISCGKKIDRIEYSLSKDSIDVLIQKSIQKGDSRAYNKVQSYFCLNDENDKILYVSIIMAHKYNIPKAYYDIYWTLATPPSGESINDLDSETRYLALYYLLKSYELGYVEAKYNINEIFGEKQTIPNSSIYLVKMCNVKNKL